MNLDEHNKKEINIYKISNIVNGKVYIGQTIDSLERRWANHVSSAANNFTNTYFSNAIKKYGRDSFTIEALDKVVGRETANKLEKEYISLYQSSNREKGYNSTTGGDCGFVYNPETAKKISNRLKGRKLTPYQKECLLKSLKGRKLPKSSRDKISESNSRKDAPLEVLLDLYVNKKMNTYQIAELLNYHQSSVHNRLRRYVKMRPNKGETLPQFRKDLNSEEILQMYEKEKLSMIEIAKLLGTSHHTVKRRLKEKGITIRTRGESIQISWDHKKKNQENKIAILARTNFALHFVEEELAQNEIPYYYLGDSGFYNRSEVKSVLAYLQCVAGITDAALCTAIRSPFHPSKYIKKKQTLDEIKKNKQEFERTAWETLTQAANSNRAIQEFVNFIRGRIAYRDLPAKDAVTYVLRDLKAYEYYHEEEAIDADNNPVENLKELVRVAAKHDTLRDFLAFIRRVQAASRRRTGVCLSTIHQFKGRESENVFVIQCCEGMMPHKRSTDLQEEQNLAYVAFSRPQKQLFISYTGTPSRFLKLEKDEVFD